jgi:protein arginine kinase activator
MVCDMCKEGDVVVNVTKVVGSEVRHLRLCEKCAAEEGVETSVVVPAQVTELLQSVHQHMPAASDDAARCTFCSSTLRDFRSSGRLGCPHCYGAFEKSLRELLRRVHGNSRHVGHRYVAPSEGDVERSVTATELRERLQRAIESEQFEMAADIRDKLRGLE